MEKKIKIFIIILSQFLLISCQKQENIIRSTNDIKNPINFDIFLKCNDYSLGDFYYYTPDYGCIYNPQSGNTSGNISIYLIPNSQEITNAYTEKTINKLSIDEIKKQFDILLFLVPLKDLNHNEKADPNYYPKEKFTEYLYKYESKNKNWKLILDKQFNSSEEEQTWKNNILKSNANNISTNLNQTNTVVEIENIKSQQINDGYQLNDEKECDLNKDGKLDKILIFSNSKEFNSNDNSTQKSPIYIFINKGNNQFEILTNNNIFRSHFNYSFHQLVIKDNYFTIELESETSDSFYQKYITFKFDTSLNKILLHKDNSIITSSNSEAAKYNYTQKDFGTILFENYDSDKISEQLNNK